jgi:hypothetical protein
MGIISNNLPAKASDRFGVAIKKGKMEYWKGGKIGDYFERSPIIPLFQFSIYSDIRIMEFV